MLEHADLLYKVEQGILQLDKKLIPEYVGNYFEPYMVESQEFEFVQLDANNNEIPPRREHRMLNLQENLKKEPVRSIFQRVVDKMWAKIMGIKIIVEFVHSTFLTHMSPLFAKIMSCDKESQCRYLGLICAKFLVD